LSEIGAGTGSKLFAQHHIDGSPYRPQPLLMNPPIFSLCAGTSPTNDPSLRRATVDLFKSLLTKPPNPPYGIIYAIAELHLFFTKTLNLTFGYASFVVAS
jgi:hypothetical protein